MARLGFLLGCLILAVLIAAPANADSVNYTITGTFGADVSSAPLSGAGGTYDIAFSLPQQPTPDYFDATAGDFALADVPISYAFQCAGCTTPASFSGSAESVDFANSGLGGMLVVEFLSGGHDYYWQFSGDQLFNGAVENPTLGSYGPTSLVDCGVFELDSGAFVDVGDATITAQVVSTPEPSTFAFLAVSALLGALVLFAKLLRS